VLARHRQQEAGERVTLVGGCSKKKLNKISNNLKKNVGRAQECELFEKCFLGKF
jgi:hypothetical protein